MIHEKAQPTWHVVFKLNLFGISYLS